MDLTFVGIRDAGDLASERVVLRATASCDIGRYVLFAAKYSDNSLRGGNTKFAYWFPDREINAEDLIILYTKSGKSNKKTNKLGRISHFLYANRDDFLWRSDQIRPVLMLVSTWTGWRPDKDEV